MREVLRVESVDLNRVVSSWLQVVKRDLSAVAAVLHYDTLDIPFTSRVERSVC